MSTANRPVLSFHPEVAEALRSGRPVVALESTLIAHGLPWPLNLETARDAEQVIRAEGAVPATIGVIAGQPTIGLTDAQLQVLAEAKDVLKASSRDLAVAMVKGRTAATTVAGTMLLAHRVGIRVFATGGIGGAHRGTSGSWDISADLIELARTPVAVVCAGAKSILDIPRTLEILETHGVPVVGYGTDDFPAFYLPSSGEPVSCRVDSVLEAGRLIQTHWSIGGTGVVIAQPFVADVALDPMEFNQALDRAEGLAAGAGVRGKALTPFLLARLAELTGGKTLEANRSLVVANARLAAQIAAVIGGTGELGK
jgi:pseudouridine-5'-phosphate glycosidase